MTGPDWASRFWAKVDKDGPVSLARPDLGPCWIWTASVNVRRGGYGQFRLHGRTRKAHQVAYELGVAPLPPGTEPDHLCRVHRCVNWRHLEAVTRRVNFLRGMHPTAVSVRTGLCGRGLHSMADAYVKPDGRRECRACANDQQRARRMARRGAA